MRVIAVPFFVFAVFNERRVFIRVNFDLAMVKLFKTI